MHRISRPDIAQEFAASQAVDAIAATIPCPSCGAPRLHAFHIGVDAEWKGIYKPGCLDCMYVEGQEERATDVRQQDVGSTKGT